MYDVLKFHCPQHTNNSKFRQNYIGISIKNKIVRQNWKFEIRVVNVYFQSREEYKLLPLTQKRFSMKQNASLFSFSYCTLTKTMDFSKEFLSSNFLSVLSCCKTNWIPNAKMKRIFCWRFCYKVHNTKLSLISSCTWDERNHRIVLKTHLA